jgi:hypothetical protein
VWRKFLFRFLSAAFLSLSVIGTLNYLVNPDGLYSTHLLPQILWGARPQKAALLRSLQPPPEALILGSSRVMNLPTAAVQQATGLVTFNAGVDSAKAEDFYIMLRYAVEQAHLKPRLVIIGCDVEAFHNHEAPHYYLQEPTLLASFLWHNQSPYWRWQSFTRLLSHEETELSLISLYKAARGQARSRFPVDPDGYTHYDAWEEQRAKGRLTLDSEIRTTIQRFAPRYTSYSGISSERLEYFEATLQYAQQHAIEVIVFLTPIHPAVEAGLSSYGYDQRKRDAAAAVDQLCANWQTPFYDFSSPESFGSDPTHFYDGVHYDDTLAATMLAKMLPVRAHAIQ